MPVWFVPIAAGLLALAYMTGSRLKIPRDPTQEKPDDSQSILAYDRINHWLLFSIIRFYFLRQLGQLHPQGTLLDAGCGPGYLAISIAQQFPDLRITGIDLSPEMVSLASRNSSSRQLNTRVTFQSANIQQMPFASNSLDFIVSTLSLHHWTDPASAMREIHRILKPGGELLIFDLRRDIPRILFYITRLGQHWLAPLPIQRANGGEGSIWSSFTPQEMRKILSASPFSTWKVDAGWGWAYIRAMK